MTLCPVHIAFQKGLRRLDSLAANPLRCGPLSVLAAQSALPTRAKACKGPFCMEAIEKRVGFLQLLAFRGWLRMHAGLRLIRCWVAFGVVCWAFWASLSCESEFGLSLLAATPTNRDKPALSAFYI